MNSCAACFLMAVLIRRQINCLHVAAMPDWNDAGNWNNESNGATYWMETLINADVTEAEARPLAHSCHSAERDFAAFHWAIVKNGILNRASGPKTAQIKGMLCRGPLCIFKMIETASCGTQEECGVETRVEKWFTTPERTFGRLSARHVHPSPFSRPIASLLMADATHMWICI